MPFEVIFRTYDIRHLYRAMDAEREANSAESEAMRSLHYWSRANRFAHRLHKFCLDSYA